MDPDDRERKAVHPDAESDRDRGGGDLTEKLLPPDEPAEVDDRADRRRHCGAEEQAARLGRQVQERERRHEDPEEERKAAEPWHRTAVQPTGLRPVDDAEQPRHASDCRREQNDDDERDERAPDHVQVMRERLEHQRATTSPTITSTITPTKRTPASAAPRPTRRA